jgi:hypothetical protein
MAGRGPTDLFTKRSLVTYSCCLAVAMVLGVVTLAAGAEPRLALAVFAAGAFVALLALRPKDS